MSSSRSHRRLLVLAPSMGLGGAERQTFSLLTAIDRTWTTLLCTLDAEGDFFTKARDAGVATRCLGVRGALPVRGILRLRATMRAFCPDVVLARGFSATTLGRIAAASLAPRPAFVVAEHSATRMAYRKPRHDLVDGTLRPLTDAFICVAEGQREYLVGEKGIPEGKLHVIPNGVELPSLPVAKEAARRGLGLDPSDFVVGIIGSMRPEKDHLTFVSAAAVAARQLPNARFVMVGDGPMRDRIEQAIDAEGLRERMLLTGARPDVENVLPAFDVFSLSSLTEALPMAVLEAMAYELPVVGTCVGALPEIITPEVGVLVPPQDPEALARAWMALHHDANTRVTMGRAGRAIVERDHSVRQMALEHERLFESLIRHEGAKSRPRVMES